jgi:hypothetical protein
MGTSSLLDIIGSFLVAGILLLMGLQLNATAMEVKAVYSQNYNLQTNLTTVVDIMESDFRKIGYCRDWRRVADPTQSIRIADSNRIRFRCDYNNDGHLDSVTYAVSSPNKLLDTPNPYDMLLYRVLNTDTTVLRLGITQFRFTYRDGEDSLIAFPITNPRLVYYMTITVAVSNPAPYVDQFSNDPSKYQVYWKQMRLITKNLANR